MKKTFLSVALILILSLCACNTQPASSQTIKFGDMSAENVVDLLNSKVEEADNLFIVGMNKPDDDDYSDVGVTPYMELNFKENSEGTLDECRLYWFEGGNDEETGYSSGFYTAILTAAFVPDIQEDIVESIQTGTSMSWNSNDTVVKFVTSAAGANYLTFMTEEQYQNTQ